MKNKDWVLVPGYENNYKIFKDGRIFSLKRKIKRLSKGVDTSYFVKEKLMKSTISEKRYRVIGLSLNGKVKGFYLHRLLYISFIGEIENDMFVDHKDRNSLNNDLSNLRLLSARDSVINTKPVGDRKFKGVRLTHNKTNPWGARFSDKHIGYFKTEIDAARAYDNFVARLTDKEVFKNVKD